MYLPSLVTSLRPFVNVPYFFPSRERGRERTRGRIDKGRRYTRLSSGRQGTYPPHPLRSPAPYLAVLGPSSGRRLAAKRRVFLRVCGERCGVVCELTVGRSRRGYTSDNLRPRNNSSKNSHPAATIRVTDARLFLFPFY